MLIGSLIDLFLRDTLRTRLLQRLHPLVEAGDTDAVALLAEYAATEQKPDLAQTALQSLRSVRHQRAIHQVCQVWLDLRKRGEAYPAQVLESLIREQRWVASQPTDLRVYTALLNEVRCREPVAPRSRCASYSKSATRMTPCCRRVRCAYWNA
jgi:hypothetical protein